MKCYTAIALLAFCLPLTSLSRADDKADLTALQSEIESLQKQLANLKSQLAEVENERDSLRSELKKSGAVETPVDKPVVAPVGTIWKGKQLNQKGEGAGWEWTVTARDEKKITFRAKGEFGVIWEYDASFTSPDEFKLLEVRRIQKSSKVKDPQPVGAITGRGSITAKNQLTVEVFWKEGKLDMKFLGDFVEPKAEN